MTQSPRESYRCTISRAAQPTAAIIDSQPVKTTEMGGPRGYDGGKKIKARKRHSLVDTQDTMLKTKVHPPDVDDRAGRTNSCCRGCNNDFRPSSGYGPTPPIAG